MDSVHLVIYISVALLLIAFFTGIEIAFISASRLTVELKKKQGLSSGSILSKFMEEPSRFIGVCLIGISVFLICYGLLFSELMRTSLWNPLKLTNAYVKLLADTIFSSLIVLIIGVFLPRAIFRAKNNTLLNFFAPVAQLFYKIFNPVASLFVKLSEAILKYLFNVRPKDKDEPFIKIDLDNFYQQTHDQDPETQELNTELFENALSLPSVRVRQCLVPRTEIEATEINTPVDDVLKLFLETKLSKLVVYEGNIDNIQGYVHQLDLFKKPTELRSILLPIPVVPETMSATDLINKFSKERKSIAWVVDEFGGTAGIITMEDILEEIFGEIKDEYDTEEFVEKQIAENEFIFSGRLELDYLNEKYSLDFPNSDSETLSGYIINQHETIPRAKERIIIDKYEFDIVTVSDTRIEMVKLKILR
ncbi:hemolysin family protein [Parafilimonas sp.]|uniref:hemolysin family protein n=1 Tax=Parafilimonas sp. TaxID=1969739 RepID=UPI0039E257E6